MPVQDTSRLGRLRDNVACRLANLALRLATPWYQAMVAGLIKYGMEASARDYEKEQHE